MAVIAGEQTYAAAKNGTLTTAQVAADLNGVAALSQAYVGTGKTPTQAALQTGASTATALASVVAALPNAPISQASTNTLWQAAAIVSAQAPAAPGPTGPEGQSGAAHNCSKDGHVYGRWYKQTQMFYIPEQPAHICKYCGAFQNSSGRLMELVKKEEVPGGTGTMTLKEANEFLDAEMLRDFGSWDKYKGLEAHNWYINYPPNPDLQKLLFP